jgi:hypothetical protein
MYKYLYKIPLLGLNIFVVTILLNFALEVMSKQSLPTPITISLDSIKNLNTCTFQISGQFLGYCFVLFGFLLNIFIKGFVQFINELDYYFNQISAKALKSTIIGLLYINCIIFLLLISYKVTLYMFYMIHSPKTKNKIATNLIKTQNNIEHEYVIESTDSIFSDERVEEHLSNINNLDIKDTNTDNTNTDNTNTDINTDNNTDINTDSDNDNDSDSDFDSDIDISDDNPPIIQMQTVAKEKNENQPILESKPEKNNLTIDVDDIVDDIVDDEPTKTEIKEAEQISMEYTNMTLIKYKGNDYYIDELNDCKVYDAVPLTEDNFIIGQEVGMFDMNEGKIKLYKDIKTNFNPIFG